MREPEGETLRNLRAGDLVVVPKGCWHRNDAPGGVTILFMTPQVLRARAEMIECGGYGFGERVAALLGAAASPQTIALVQHTLRATNPAGFMQAARFLTGGETPPLGAGLTMPLLLIQGEEDRVTPAAANAELLASAVPDATLVMLPGCGHLPEAECRRGSTS